GDLGAKLRWNPASFYDLVGPTKISRKGFNARLEWDRGLIRDRPRTLDLTLGADGWTGLERLPDYQNVSTSPGFSRLLASSVDLHFKNVRSSIGAVENEKGVEWRLSAGVNGVRFERSDAARWRGFPWITGSWDAG